MLRADLSSVDYRIATITDLDMAMHRRFGRGSSPDRRGHDATPGNGMTTSKPTGVIPSQY
jgi:hypothetical protein